MEKRFIELLHKNQGIIHKICMLYFQNRSEKEDYQQELIIQLWKAFPSFNNQSKFSSWMYRVCLNAAIDITRKEKTQPEYVSAEMKELDNIPEERKKLNSNQEKLQQAISMLSVIDKAIISLYLEGFSYKEIAEIIGISESNTGVKINRIKAEILNLINNGK